MITASERKALLFLTAVIALGSGTRVVSARSPAATPADSAALALQLARVESVRAGQGGRRAKGRRAAPKKTTAELLAALAPIDLDTASASDIEQLPGIGKVVAARIVANRDSFGPFGSLDALRRVKGVGPALSERVRPYVTFSGVARPANAVLSPGRALQERRRAPRATRVPDR